MNINHLHYEPIKEIVQEKNILRGIEEVNEEKYIEESNKKHNGDNVNGFKSMSIDEDIIELNTRLINANKRSWLSLHQLKKNIRNKDVVETSLVRKPLKRSNFHMNIYHLHFEALKQTERGKNILCDTEVAKEN